MLSNPSKDFKGDCPRMESSQNMILEPFPGIQVRLEVIRSRDFRQRERMGEPFLVRGDDPGTSLYDH